MRFRHKKQEESIKKYTNDVWKVINGNSIKKLNYFCILNNIFCVYRQFQ